MESFFHPGKLAALIHDALATTANVADVAKLLKTKSGNEQVAFETRHVVKPMIKLGVNI
jgi:hypothetical protein